MEAQFCGLKSRTQKNTEKDLVVGPTLKITENEGLKSLNSRPYIFYCFKNTTIAVLSVISSKYACEPLFHQFTSSSSYMSSRIEWASAACIAHTIPNENLA